MVQEEKNSMKMDTTLPIPVSSGDGRLNDSNWTTESCLHENSLQTTLAENKPPRGVSLHNSLVSSSYSQENMVTQSNWHCE